MAAQVHLRGAIAIVLLALAAPPTAPPIDLDIGVNAIDARVTQRCKPKAHTHRGSLTRAHSGTALISRLLIARLVACCVGPSLYLARTS
jgi:hypothetical protein